jgi:hypothetical protein
LIFYAYFGTILIFGFLSRFQTFKKMMKPPKITTISKQEYQSFYWPLLANFVKFSLSSPLSHSSQFSEEELYRTVYNLCCQKYSSQLYDDFLLLVNEYLHTVLNSLLATSDHRAFLAMLSNFLYGFEISVHNFCIVFRYLDKSYLFQKNQKDLKSLLYSMFNSNIICVPEIKLRLEQALRPEYNTFSLAEPSQLHHLVQGLYSLNKEYANLNQSLFSLYIPCLKMSQGLEADVHETFQFLSQMQQSEAFSPSPHSDNRKASKRKFMIETT